jgi:hypothetical protein
MIFMVGDYFAGMIVGALTAFAVRMVVWPGMDMVMAMIVGMALGMSIHVVLGLVLAPMIGMFNAMIPASLSVADRDVRRHVFRDARLDGRGFAHPYGGNCGRDIIRRYRRGRCPILRSDTSRSDRRYRRVM